METTYVPERRKGWWGGPDKRVRCLKTDKVVLPSQAEAEYKAKNIRERELFRKPRADGKVMNAYQCGYCGFWHVGHGRKKRNEG